MRTWHSYFHVPRLFTKALDSITRLCASSTNQASLFTDSTWWINAANTFPVKVWSAGLPYCRTQDKRAYIVKFPKLVKLHRSALGQVGNPLDPIAFPLGQRCWILDGVVTPLTKTFRRSTKRNGWWILYALYIDFTILNHLSCRKRECN